MAILTGLGARLHTSAGDFSGSLTTINELATRYAMDEQTLATDSAARRAQLQPSTTLSWTTLFDDEDAIRAATPTALNFAEVYFSEPAPARATALLRRFDIDSGSSPIEESGRVRVAYTGMASEDVLWGIPLVRDFEFDSTASPSVTLSTEIDLGAAHSGSRTIGMCIHVQESTGVDTAASPMSFRLQGSDTSGGTYTVVTKKSSAEWPKLPFDAADDSPEGSVLGYVAINGISRYVKLDVQGTWDTATITASLYV